METTTDVETLDSKGRSVVLKHVKALKNTRTGKLGIYPDSLALAEMIQLAAKYDLQPRELPILLFAYAKVGHFKSGILHNRLAFNKSLFYVWKDLEKEGLGDAFPHDHFLPHPAGPVPQHLDQDLKRLSESGLVKVSLKPWGEKESEKAQTTELLPEGLKVAKEIWDDLPQSFRDEILKVKTEIYPLDTETIKKRVHKEYPEYLENNGKEEVN